MREEYILCSAIWYKESGIYLDQPLNIQSGFVVCGRRHYNILSTIGQKFLFKSCDCVYGFLTNLNRFVDSKEGAEIAYNYGQIKNSKKELYSEDIW